MARYIYGKRNAIHIVDIRETLRGLLRAKKFVTRAVANGGDVLFVGTKRQAREIVQRHADRCGMHYVTERWLGGTLTNFRTIRSRLQRLEELEALVASPEWETGYSKKMKSTLTRELTKIRRNLGGIRNMSKVPAVLVAVDVRKEHNGLRESAALGIPRVCLVDTDSDPDQVDIVIPGNDDAMRAIELVFRELADAVEEGKKARPEPVEPPTTGRSAPAGRRRPRRPDGPGGRDADAPRPAPADANVPAQGSAPSASTPEVPVPQPADAGSTGGGEEPSPS